jgi:magnesium chelatase family protein
VAALLPPATPDAMEESRLYFSQSGACPGPWPPLRRVSAAQAARLFRFDARSGLCGELSLAHEGVLALELGRKPARLLDSLKECMEDGSIRAYHQGRFYSLRTNLLVVASSATCGAAGCTRPAGPDCHCDSIRRLAIAADEREAIPFFGLILPPVENGCGSWPDWHQSRARVAAARARALCRQGEPNGRLSLAEAEAVLQWSPGAATIAQAFVGARLRALRRLAVTIHDLRTAQENGSGAEPGVVSRDDALEARHYVASVSGISFSSASAPAVNSTAMP